MLGLKERAEKYVVKYLRPWLLCDVSPEVQISTSGVTLQLQNLEFDVEALNGVAMQSSPMLIKEGVKVEKVELIFAPFRMPVVTILVQGLHIVLQPRSTDDDWWEKKMEKTAEQELTAALLDLDPQGSSAHAAAETLAGGKTENKLIKRFLASLALTCVKVEFRDCSVRVVAHARDQLQHFCHIPLGSFVFGKEKQYGFASSGGLAGAVAKASSRVWKGSGTTTSSSCSIRGLGLQVETRSAEEVVDQSTSAGSERKASNADAKTSEIEEIAKDYLSAQSSSGNGGMSVVALPEISSKDKSKYAVIFGEIDLVFSMKELTVDSLELETQEAAVGLDFEEIRALQILAGQVKGPEPTVSSKDQKKDDESGSEEKSLENSRNQRTPLELWKRGIRKAVELSSRRRLTFTIKAGVSRRRYSTLYEGWLNEVEWGQKKDADVEKVRSKKQFERIQKLSKDLSELQKELPLEAIALGRRIARRRVSAALHSKDLLERSNSTSSTAVRTSKMYSSFRNFSNAVSNWVAIASIAIEGKASGISGSVSAAWRLIKNKWKGTPASEGETSSDAAAEAQSEASVSWKSSTSDVRDKAIQSDIDRYFQLSSDQESEIGSVTKKWAMAYSVTIRRGSIVFASGAIGAVRKVEDDPPSDGSLTIDSALIPALHITWENLLLAYGSTRSATGSSITCGNLQAELLSILPSQLPKELTKGLDDEVFHKDFISLGRWSAKSGDRALLVSSRPCPQKGDGNGHTAHSLPLADGMYAKHWNWQDRRLEVWAQFRATSGEEGTSGGRSNGNGRPFFIAEFNSLDDDPIIEDCPGSVIKCSLAMGQLDCSLKGSYLSRIRLLLDQLTVSRKSKPSNSTTPGNRKYQTNSRAAITLEEFCDETYKVNLAKSREAMVSAVPGKSILFTAVVDGPKVRLSASANELFDFQNQDEQDTDRNVSRYEPSMAATIVVDLGRLELAMWPPQKVQADVPASDTGDNSGSPSGPWTEDMENKAWLRKPPVPNISEDFGVGTYWEHEQVANNLYLSSTGLVLNMEVRRESLKKLPIAGPLGFIIETSFCWDQFSSLFSTSKSVCASVNVKIPSLSVQSHIHEVAIMLQVLAFYTESLKPIYSPDSTLIVKNEKKSSRFDVVAPEDLHPTFETSEEDTETEGSRNYGEIALSTTFALGFSLEVGNFKMVLGDGRVEDGARGGASGVRQDEGLRYEPREERLTLVNRNNDRFTTWEQMFIGANMGREAYVSLENFLIESSIGDGLQLYVCTSIRDAAVRIVDCTRGSSQRDLNEIREQFFRGSLRDSKTSLTITEVSVVHTSLKVMGPNYHQTSGVNGDSDTGNATITTESPQENERIGDLEGEDESVSSKIPIHSEADLDQSSESDSSRSIARPKSMESLHRDEEDEGDQQRSPREVDLTNTGVSSDVETQWLVISVEVGKVLVTDGSLDVLIAKVAKVARGSDILHMDFEVDWSFKKLSLSTEGGLVLLHTAALATLVQFGSEIQQLVKKAGILFTSPESKRESYRDDGIDFADEPSWATPSLEKSSRSSSLPPPSGRKPKKLKRTISAPPRSRVPSADSANSTSPTFGGLLFSKISGFSIVLARHSSTDEGLGEASQLTQVIKERSKRISRPLLLGEFQSSTKVISIESVLWILSPSDKTVILNVESVPGEGVLFELDVSSMVEVDGSAKKAVLDLTRFAILGLQARVPGNSHKKPGRLSSRAPQFGSSVNKAAGSAGESVSPLQEQPKNLLRKDSSGLLEETDSGDLELLSRSELRGIVDKEAQRFGKALSEFNSFILEKLSVSCTVERVADTDKVWKWSNAWKGYCTIDGLNVAITTSEIQLVESIVSPLSNLTGSTGSSAADSATNALLEGTKESPDENEVDIPDGSIIAIKDVHEHCYLAAEEATTTKGNFRLVGVLHYTLAGDKALFKVQYQDSSTTTKSKTAWFSLLSLHAKNSDGEPFRVHYRPGSGLVDVSSTNDGSWEQWKFLPTETSEAEKGDFDIRNSSSRRVFHIVNQKSKTGIAFEDNVPLLVKHPGNPFKIKVVAKPTQSDTNSEAKALTQKDETPLQTPPLDDYEAANLVTSIPHVLCKFDTIVLTVLHEAAGGLHLLPLLRVRVPGTEGVIQAGVTKSRTILQCGIVLEYYEMQTTSWVPVVNPIETEIFYRARNVKHAVMATNSEKIPVALFTRFRKVDFVVSEPSLDAVLFLIGALDLAGPFTVKHSPVQANRCLVENHTGVDLLCRFDQGASNMPGDAGPGKPGGMDQVDGMIPAWHSDSFLMRHMTSRRDTTSAKVASILELKLQKSGGGYMSSTLFVTLGEPGVIATRTRLHDVDGQRSAPGPIVVVDVRRRNQDGIFLTVSPMIRIRNASGLLLELRCRRDKQGEEGAVVVLEDGDVIDDSMGAFDALNLSGELKKALTSLNLGNYLLSIRPTEAIPSADADNSDTKINVESNHEWSNDVKGAKLVKAAGLFDKLQYTFQKSMKVRNVDSSFGMVYCPVKPQLSGKASEHTEQKGYHFMIRTTCRKVPISRPKSPKDLEQEPRGRYTFVAWQEQQEILLLPTVRVINLLTSSITIILTLTPEGKRRGDSAGDQSLSKATIQSGATACMYIQLGDLFLTIKHEDFGLSTMPICLGVGNKEFSRNAKAGNLKDLELVVDFGDGIHQALVAVSRGEDGVLEAAIFTRYVLHNDSHVPLLCCSSKHKSSRRWGGLRAANELEWPDSGKVTTIAPYSRVSWLDRSTKLLFKRREAEAEAEASLLDIESLSGSTEISLKVQGQDSVLSRIQLGVNMHLPADGDTSSSCIIRLVPRYIVANESGEAILVCQDGFQDDADAMVSLGPGERAALHAQVLPDRERAKAGGNLEAGPEVLLKVRFRPKETGWNWSGPVCAAALGSFSVKIRRPQSEDFAVQMPRKEELWFAVADVQEEASSLITTFRKQAADAIPYHIENVLRSASITYSQQGLNESEVLQSGASVGYVWDDLGLPHKLTVKVSGTSLSHDINLDKLRSWKSFRAVRRKKGLLQIPFLNELSNMALYGDEATINFPSESSLPPVGYEVYADGPTRVLRICEERDSKTDRRWQSNISSPKKEIEIRIPLFTMSIVEPAKEIAESEQVEGDSPTPIAYVPIITLRLTNVLIEALIPPEYTLFQLKAERLDIDVRWQGAPVAAMLRGHGQDRFSKGHTVFHMAVVMSNLARNPIQLKYASILLQAMDLNLDEDTLMKLAPFYRSSLSESTAPSRRIYFERFEIHPVKIVGSFLPGKPRADYSSGQETLRALLHSVIKIPAVRGTTVELNGVLLSHALLTFKQLAIKCAQHYSWYSMRAIYIARGSKLLPPGFASLFDDSAASSLDVFFDPSSGSVDLQGLTLGMFGVLSRGLRKKGKGGTQRYLGDLEKTVKAAGSNLLFAVITEVSDSVLKGADANGFDGVVTGFRRGIVNVAMKPSVLRSAVVQGGATRRIKLDRIVGTDEAYIEGYLQAMLDALFKQNYLRVKVIDDQVILKNLPPNTTLVDEIMSCVKNFLIGEGLLAGETSAAALSSLRRLRGENERRIGPTVLALCEQLLVIIVVRSMRRQTIRLLHQNNIHIIGEDEPAKAEYSTAPEENKPKETGSQGFFSGINYKRAITGFFISSALAYADGRICRHIPNPLVRRIVSGFLLSFVE